MGGRHAAELQQARHADWVERAHREQSNAVLLTLVVLGLCVVGISITVVYYALPAGGPRALQPDWGAWLRSTSTWLVSFAGRLALGALAAVSLTVATPFAFAFFVWGVGKVCEFGFDALAFVGRLLYPVYPVVETCGSMACPRDAGLRRRGRRR